MLNEQTFVAEAELSTVNKQSWILYAKKFLISCSCNRFCQYPVCARVPDYTYATFEEYARWDSLTSKLPWPQTQEEQIPVYQNVPRNMAAMIHNVLPVASVNTCGSDCTMQPVLCQTCSSECLSQLSGTMSQSDQPADMKFICQSQQSAAEIMKASQTVDGDNYLAPYSPHPAPCHFWLNPRLKLGFWVKVLWHLQTSNATQQPDSTPHKKMLSMCAAKHDKTTGKSVCFKDLNFTAEFWKLYEKPGTWPWKQHWKKFTLVNLLLKPPKKEFNTQAYCLSYTILATQKLIDPHMLSSVSEEELTSVQRQTYTYKETISQFIHYNIILNYLFLVGG
jgi:hypothetical protein